MEYINLIDLLPEKDKIKLNNYINLYGVDNKCFIGLDKWLQNWSHANQRLYRLLGNNLYIEKEFTYTKNIEEVTKELAALSEHPFYEQIEKFIWFYLYEKYDKNSNGKIICQDLNYLMTYCFTNPTNPTFDRVIKFKKNENSKLFQIQKGTKPLKVLYRVMQYFKDEYEFDFKAFEDFKTQYSIILSEKSAKGTMVFSIHPLDYITMSDNNSNWTSCMSWMDDGCYRIGTIEMMNSNNVLCCFLKHKDKDFNFSKIIIDDNDPEKENYTWNNKKWRSLVYITKDIIMSGKAYPFFNDDFCKYLLKEIKTLAHNNLNWNYSFGPELYQDMKHIYSNAAMTNNRRWIQTKYTKKHNIIWDTKGMYNDMLNATSVKYWCYRNKVNQNKIISVSGKAPCLCCGEDKILEPQDCYDYNERFYNTGEVVCQECTDEFFTCYCCGVTKYKNFDYINVKSLDRKVCVCKNCYFKYIKKCPDCGKPFIISKKYNVNDFNNKYEGNLFIVKDTLSSNEDLFMFPYIFTLEMFTIKGKNEQSCLEKVFLCDCCKKKLKKKYPQTTKVSKKRNFIREMDATFNIHIIPSENNTKYLYDNLEEVDEKITEVI